MSIIALIFFLSVVIPDSPAIIQDNQGNYSNGIIVNQPNLFQDAQSDYNNGILKTKKSVHQDGEVISTLTQISLGTSSSGGGGGGGSITSSENFSNILQFEQHEGILIKDKPISFKFNLPIYEILLIGKENEYDVSVRVELLKDKPQKATIKPDGEVIQYFNVVTSTKRMKEAVIRFKTNQSAKLLKWNNSDWVNMNMVENVKDLGLEIPQECISEQKICYTYRTDTLSNFAVVAQKQEQLSQVDVVLPADTSASLPALPVNIPNIPKQTSGFGMVMVIIVIIVAVGGRKLKHA